MIGFLGNLIVALIVAFFALIATFGLLFVALIIVLLIGYPIVAGIYRK